MAPDSESKVCACGYPPVRGKGDRPCPYCGKEYPQSKYDGTDYRGPLRADGSNSGHTNPEQRSHELIHNVEKRVVVISDIHSRKRKLVKLLQDIGAMDELGNRLPGYQFVQVGDAISAGYGMEEAEFYTWWTGFLTDDDVELVGNHEAPILWPYDDRFKFYGYEPGDGGTSGCVPQKYVAAGWVKGRAPEVFDLDVHECDHCHANMGEFPA